MRFMNDLLKYSVVVPVFNRPNEVQELLESLATQTFRDFEVVIVEDGSTETSEAVVKQFAGQLNISYFYKENSGPGDSRNYGMRMARGNYFLILDSDCILPPEYMTEVDKSLKADYADCFGGTDTALDSFTDVQKAINFAMTSVLTTGGVRGASEKLGKFQPRSFNMGISERAFKASGGFGRIHPGEDPDLTIRLWKLGFETRLFKNVSVYHKRRIDWEKFYTQVNKFGKVRPVLDRWHPEYAKITYFFPAAFLVGGVVACVALLPGFPYFFLLYLGYFLLCFLVSSVQNKSIKIGLMSLRAVMTQFTGYGSGFLKSFWWVRVRGKDPERVFPRLFFSQPSASDARVS